MPRILLVEDERDVAGMVEHVLIAARHQVDAVYRVADGIRHLGRDHYDLGVADARLPDGNGMQVADLAADMGTKSLIITGYAFAYPELRHYEYLLKPLRPHELRDAVQRLLGTTDQPAPSRR